MPFLPLSLLHLTVWCQRPYVVWNFNFTIFFSFIRSKTWVAANSVVTVFLINTGIISPLLMILFTSPSPNSGLSAELTCHFYIKKGYLTIFIKFLWFQCLSQILFTLNNRGFYFPPKTLDLRVMIVKEHWLSCL